MQGTAPGRKALAALLSIILSSTFTLQSDEAAAEVEVQMLQMQCSKLLAQT